MKIDIQMLCTNLATHSANIDADILNVADNNISEIACGFEELEPKQRTQCIDDILKLEKVLLEISEAYSSNKEFSGYIDYLVNKVFSLEEYEVA